ncbi:hypothetical protein [Ramlibacter ginsenosidimutans]|uniref:hypothetical protein n=1 Tax=Ramlibacter ginsenosidimutans TaxID=502333 RepID=UPI00191436AF
MDDDVAEMGAGFPWERLLGKIAVVTSLAAALGWPPRVARAKVFRKMVESYA